MTLIEIIKQPEGRKIEFKKELPISSELAKTIIALSNDAGGDIFIGIQDNPREIIGIDEEIILQIEEKIANIIHDSCQPTILPDISILHYQNKAILKIHIYKGSSPPYHLKNKGIEQGTYIRIGSTSRQASPEMIAELVRHKNNISFDSELCHTTAPETIVLDNFKALFEKITGEELSTTTFSKLELTRSFQNINTATNALVLLSDDRLKKQLFPNATIECARFKGLIPGNFIDQKTIEGSLILQAEEAYAFLLRHISQASSNYNGVYRNDRWEYPVVAIREVVRNAVVHRDYSLTGKDIKIAIFDNKIEITSPGKLLPSIDFNDMESGQSDIRNKTLAPVFRKLGIIEKWGNGLRLIHEELRKYPEIEFTWSEPGLAFRVSFIKKELDPNTTQNATQNATRNATQKIADQIIAILRQNPTISRKEIAQNIGTITSDGVKYHLKKLVNEGKIKRIGSDKGGSWEIINKEHPSNPNK